MNLISNALLYGQDYLIGKVSQVIASGDGMYLNGNDEHYFSVGASALALILQSLEAAYIEKDEIHRILDYACGYGRVLRWLKAAFPNAYILGADVNQDAIDGAASATGVDTKRIDPELNNDLDDPFDLIWVGSLLTHLPENDVIKVIKYLKQHLTSNGVLIFTSHGRLVEKLMASGKKNYNLKTDEILKLLTMLKKGKFGFQNYENRSNFGISVTYVSKMNSLIEECDLETIFFRSEGWDKHQDVFACRIRDDLDFVLNI